MGVVALGISAACVAAMCIAIPVMLHFGILQDAHKYVNSYKPTTFTVLSTNQNGYTCCDTRNCLGCNIDVAGLTSCSALNNNLTQGACDAGSYCCHKACHTCYTTTCQKCTSGPYKGQDQCNCSTSSYSCNCYCDQQTDHRQCASYCSTCWRPSATLQYDSYTTSVGATCGIDDRVCLDNFLSQYALDEQIPGFYQTTNPKSIILRAAPDYKWNPGYIAGMVLFSLVLTCATCVMVYNLWRMWQSGYFNNCTFCSRRKRVETVELQPPAYTE